MSLIFAAYAITVTLHYKLPKINAEVVDKQVYTFNDYTFKHPKTGNMTICQKVRKDLEKTLKEEAKAIGAKVTKVEIGECVKVK